MILPTEIGVLKGLEVKLVLVTDPDVGKTPVPKIFVIEDGREDDDEDEDEDDDVKVEEELDVGVFIVVGIDVVVEVVYLVETSLRRRFTSLSALVFSVWAAGSLPWASVKNFLSVSSLRLAALRSL